MILMKRLPFTFTVFVLFLTIFSKVVNAESPTSSEYNSSTGEEFIFATTFAGGEEYGYLKWSKKPEFYAGGVPYADYVGRKGKLEHDYIYGPLKLLKFRKAILENGEILYVETAENNKLQDVHFIKELDRAKAMIGKKIWINNANIAGSKELITPDKNISFPARHLEPVTVTGVVLENYGHARGAGSFFVKVKKASGEEGLLRFNDIYFCASNPFPPGTPSKIRQAVEQQKIMIGMTQKQARLSWGEPDKINKSVGSWGVKEQWVYGYQYLYFSNGKLTSFQTSN